MLFRSGSLPAQEAGRVAVNASQRGGPGEEGCRAGEDTQATARARCEGEQGVVLKSLQGKIDLI